VRRPIPDAARRPRDQRLDFDEQRARAVTGGDDDRSRRADRSLGEQLRRRILDLGEAGAAHLEHAELLRRSEPILVTAQDPVRAAAFALELEHDVDQVLERLGPGDRAVLGDVTDEDRRRAGGLGVRHEARRALAHLRQRAGDRIELPGVHGLDRVEREHRRLERACVVQHLVDVGLGDQREPRIGGAEPARAHRHLRDRLLARRVQDAAIAPGQTAERLGEQRRLADARIAAEEEQAAGDQTAAQHAIEFGDPGRQPVGGRRLGDVGDGDRLGAARRAAA
jgi:hypothetical protein